MTKKMDNSGEQLNTAPISWIETPKKVTEVLNSDWAKEGFKIFPFVLEFPDQKGLPDSRAIAIQSIIGLGVRSESLRRVTEPDMHWKPIEYASNLLTTDEKCYLAFGSHKNDVAFKGIIDPIVEKTNAILLNLGIEQIPALPPVTVKK
jgi:hypothetical protein